jgi:hypothetical protein
VNSFTTAKDILDKICERYEIIDPDQYGLYVCIKEQGLFFRCDLLKAMLTFATAIIPILGPDKLLDIRNLAEMMVENMSSKAKDIGYHIEFRRTLWNRQQPNICESLLRLTYHQVS